VLCAAIIIAVAEARAAAKEANTAASERWGGSRHIQSPLPIPRETAASYTANVDEATRLLIEHGYLLLFFVVLADQAGLPLPSPILLLVAGGLSGTGSFTLSMTIVVVTLATLPADWAWYELGRLKGVGALRQLCRIALEPDSCVRQTQGIIERLGSRTLLVSKFVPGLQSVTPPLAGISGMSRLSFLMFDTWGTVLWAVAYAGLGYLGRDQLTWIGRQLDQAGGLAVVIVLLMLVVYLLFKFEKRRRFVRSLQGARITPEELKTLLDDQEPVEILDLRHGFDLRLEPVQIPGARQIPLEEIERRHPEIPRDREVILYCNCPNEASSARTALRLRKYGVERVRPLHGGLAGWRARGFPVDACSGIVPLTKPAASRVDEDEDPLPIDELILRDHHGNQVLLADFWREQTVVLVLMRHFGCIFCREQIMELRDQLPSIRAEGAELVTVGNGTPEAAAAFRQEFELEFPVLVDGELRAYRAFGLRRDKLAILNPRMIPDLLRALSRGARQGPTAGDVWQLGGTFIISPGSEIKWAYPNHRAGDHPPTDQVLSALRVLQRAIVNVG